MLVSSWWGGTSSPTTVAAVIVVAVTSAVSVWGSTVLLLLLLLLSVVFSFLLFVFIINIFLHCTAFFKIQSNYNSRVRAQFLLFFVREFCSLLRL